METLPKPPAETPLFELAPEEIHVCLRLTRQVERYQLLHVLRPPSFEDWRDYERDLRATVETVDSGGEEALRFDSRTVEAASALYDRLFRRAEGYRVSAASVTAAQVPPDHKEMVARALGDVAPAYPPAAEPAPSSSPEEETGPTEAEPREELFALDLETVEVRLAAARNGARHDGLVHSFRAPSAADRVAYSRVVSQALYVQGSKTLKSILPPRLPGLAALYDRLIQSVAGYALRGRPPEDRAALLRHMDALHKKAAVQALFGE